MRLLTFKSGCIDLEFVPQDLWVGAYWKTEHPTMGLPNLQHEDGSQDHRWIESTVIHVYLTLIPTLPLHFQLHYSIVEHSFTIRNNQESSDATTT